MIIAVEDVKLGHVVCLVFWKHGLYGTMDPIKLKNEKHTGVVLASADEVREAIDTLLSISSPAELDRRLQMPGVDVHQRRTGVLHEAESRWGAHPSLHAH